MTDLSDGSDEDDVGAEEATSDDFDPWPPRCEALAVALVAVILCVLATGVLQAIALSTQEFSSLTVTVGARLRFAAQVLTPFDGVVLLVAGILVALDGITSGERRGASTTAGGLALGGVSALSVVVVLASLARLVDMLVGHVSPIGQPPTSVVARVGPAVNQLASVIAAATAGWLALRTMDDGDWDWAMRWFLTERATDEPEERGPEG